MKKTHAQTLEELESLRLTASNIEPQQDVSPDLIAQHEESLALIEDLKALLSQAKKEKEEALQQLTIRNEELASLKSAASKGADSKQQARYTQRITELEAELEKAKKWLYVPKNKTLTSCEWKGISLFSSLSREMLTFSRLNVHN